MISVEQNIVQNIDDATILEYYISKGMWLYDSNKCNQELKPSI